MKVFKRKRFIHHRSTLEGPHFVWVYGLGLRFFCCGYRGPHFLWGWSSGFTGAHFVWGQGSDSLRPCGRAPHSSDQGLGWVIPPPSNCP